MPQAFKAQCGQCGNKFIVPVKANSGATITCTVCGHEFKHEAIMKQVTDKMSEVISAGLKSARDRIRDATDD